MFSTLISFQRFLQSAYVIIVLYKNSATEEMAWQLKALTALADDLGVSFHYPNGCSQTFATPLAGEPTPSLASTGTRHANGTDVHAAKIPIVGIL